MHVNSYWKQLSPGEIQAGHHRDFVGGLWDEMGHLQARLLRSRGRQPSHRLLDMGCGALRGGRQYLRYLAPGHYFGVDINASLLEAGRREVQLAGLQDRDPTLRRQTISMRSASASTSTMQCDFAVPTCNRPLSAAACTSAPR